MIRTPIRLLPVICLALAWATLLDEQAAAGQFNPVLKIGDAAPIWTDLPGTDGRKHALADFQGKELVVVVFTCNSCPVATDYEDRIVALAKRYAGPESRVGFVAVNVNKIPEDSLGEMKKRAEERGFPFPYLFDETQRLAKDFGATFTPEVFVLNKERKVAYMGGLDDNSDPDAVKTKYLEPALEALLAGTKPAVEETVARGCMIRYARERRKK